MTCCACGFKRYGGEANAADYAGKAFGMAWEACYRQSKYCNRIRLCVSTPNMPKSKVRTVCVSSASTDLCGGQRATAVPTATRRPSGRRLVGSCHLFVWVCGLTGSLRSLYVEPDAAQKGGGSPKGLT